MCHFIAMWKLLMTVPSRMSLHTNSFAALWKQTPEPNITTVSFLFDLTSLGGQSRGGIMCWNLSILSVSHSLKPLDPVFLAAPFYQEGEEKSTEQVFLTWKTTISRNSQGKNLETFRFCTCHWEINLGYMFASLKQAFFNINFSSAQAPDFSEGSHAAWGNCATQR